MKPKKIKRKLFLNKETVSNISLSESEKIRGGGTIPLFSICSECNTCIEKVTCYTCYPGCSLGCPGGGGGGDIGPLDDTII